MFKTLLAAVAVAFISTAALAAVPGHTEGARAQQNSKICPAEASTTAALDYVHSLSPEDAQRLRLHFFQDKDKIAQIIDILDDFAGSTTDHDAYDAVAIIQSSVTGRFLVFAYKDGCQVTQKAVPVPEEIYAQIEALDGPATA